MEDTAAVEAAVEESGVRGRRMPAHGSVPLAEVLFAASASVTALAHLVTVLRRQFKKGVMVDAMGAAGVTIKADGSVPRGMVVIRHQDGEVRVRDAEGITQALLGAVTGSSPGDSPPVEPPPPGGEPRAGSAAPPTSGVMGGSGG
ncbi:hypothetical protein [Streptomyces sp. IB2014 016-6]|uniref:hypothetical protein n=1 Tax=Streptomyces sp. IB2014 016-6 TaxID=2517818 RepID=UPI0011CC2DF0|nr:hypothetical protein [Streptomyces sp. IB2014 016-6]TXL84729.1 hypothetical protein EW053_33425 [Streptomyces sp. IB2014 016-6]